jgi:hypothetical protein
MDVHENVLAFRKERERLLEDLSSYDLHLLNTMVVNRMKMIQQGGTVMSISKFNIGDKVSLLGSDAVKKAGYI